MWTTWKVSKFLCCIPLKLGIVVIGIFFLIMGFTFCITARIEKVKNGDMEGLGFYKNLLIQTLNCNGCGKVNGAALMAAFVFKMISAGLYIVVGIQLLFFGIWSRRFSLVFIPISLALDWIRKTIVMAVIDDQDAHWDWKIMASMVMFLVLSTTIQAYSWVCIYSYIDAGDEDSPSDEEEEGSIILSYSSSSKSDDSRVSTCKRSRSI